ERLSTKEINNLPVLLGERDVLKVLQYIPGIKSSGDGNTGIYVRGGGSDQNLMMLDEAPVYNASHLLGFFSTFNSDAIRDVTVYKGEMPAQYGGRLSSVLDIKMNEGNNQKYRVSGDIGLISAKINAEGPIQKDKSSFFLSARRTYADLFLKLSSDESLRNNQLYFYDINAKANYIISDKDKVYFSLYTGRDNLSLDDLFGLDWGNTTTTLRWNHVINARLFSNTSAIYSKYNYNVLVDLGGSDLSIKSSIRDWNLKQEFQYLANPNSTFRFGINSIYHTIVPGSISSSDPETIHPKEFQKRYSWENALFGSHTLTINSRLNLIYGLRFSSFSILGKGDFYTLDENHEVTDTTTYSAGQFVKTYFQIEPRISASYKISEKSSLKASYTRNTQNLHLLTNSTLSSPADRWTASSNLIQPEISDQVSLGYFRTFKDERFEFSAEAYYKRMQNQIDYRDGADPMRTEIVEKDLLYGKGRAYGIELFLKKRTGRLNGWIGYTLSRTEKRIAEINENRWYPAKQDRTHDISLVVMYELNDKWSLSGTWVYATGNAVTFPSGKYIVDGQVINYYTERNGYRVPSYHRMDLGATRKLRTTKKFSSELSFSLYNAYGRANPFMIEFRESPSDPSRSEAVKYSLFKMIPSISYRFTF
ncbi:MAG: TonB-dependent receptor, partial [Bacteroidales bacterium]|nr:TonB-dependent receptor [Bacteroidales bacterium]